MSDLRFPQSSTRKPASNKINETEKNPRMTPQRPLGNGKGGKLHDGELRSRVIVQLSDVSLEDQKRLGEVPRKRIISNLEVVNENTIIYSKTILKEASPGSSPAPRTYTQKMRFDCVGLRSDATIRSEIAYMMDELLLHGRNACLIRFSAIKDRMIGFLSRLLVTDVDQRMHRMRCSVQRISLEYFDLRKYNVVKMVDSMAPPSQKDHPKRYFRCTLELLKWIQAEYPDIWKHEHEIFDLRYIYTNLNHEMCSAKLSLVNLHLGKMDAEAKVSMRNFLENINGMQKLRPSMVTACLREYFEAPTSWRVWMLFEVPQVNGRCLFMGEEILKLAEAASTGINAVKDNSAYSSFSSKFEETPERRRPEYYLGKIRYPSLITTLNSEQRSHHTSNYSFLSSHHSIYDDNSNLNSLSHWYKVLDDKYSHLISTIDAFFEHKYKQHIERMCLELKTLSQNDREGVECPLRSPKINLSSIGSCESCNRYDLEYGAATKAFRCLVQEITDGPFGGILKVHLQRRCYELKQHLIRAQVQQLEVCQSRLTNVIREEVSALKC